MNSKQIRAVKIRKQLHEMIDKMPKGHKFTTEYFSKIFDRSNVSMGAFLKEHVDIKIKMHTKSSGFYDRYKPVEWIKI